MTYSQKLKDPRWQKRRLEVMQRDGFKCRQCGDSHSTLNVHHCVYRGKDPWDTSTGLLLTLCEKCHRERQTLEQLKRSQFEEIFAQSSLEKLARLSVKDDFESDYQSEIRWYLYACDHPQFRKAYEEVTGLNPSWPQ